MPAVVPLLIPIITAAAGVGGLVSTVTGLVGGHGGGGGESAKQLQEAQQKQAQADAQAKQRAILASLPNAQEQGGGSLGEPQLTNLASIIAGLPGESTTGAGRGALSQYLGAPPTSSTNENMVSATYGLSGNMG